jgi:hypothetical protein
MLYYPILLPPVWPDIPEGCCIDRPASLVPGSDTRECSLQMAEQDWNFAVLDDEYNNLNGGPWAGLNGFANADDLGDHW